MIYKLSPKSRNWRRVWQRLNKLGGVPILLRLDESAQQGQGWWSKFCDMGIESGVMMRVVELQYFKLPAATAAE